MGNRREQDRLHEILAWHEHNAEELRALINKYERMEQELLDRERESLDHIHIGEVS